MLNLASGIAFSMNVRDLLQLQRSVHCHGIMTSASEKQKTLHLVIFVRQLLTIGSGFKNGFYFLRKFKQFAYVPAHLVFAQLAAHLPEVECEKKEHSHLSSEGFGGRDADFRARIRVDDT